MAALDLALLAVRLVRQKIDLPTFSEHLFLNEMQVVFFVHFLQ